MKMLKKYWVLDNMIDELVEDGMCTLDPVVRSMSRQLQKRYAALTEEEQKLIWIAETIDPLMGQA